MLLHQAEGIIILHMCCVYYMLSCSMFINLFPTTLGWQVTLFISFLKIVLDEEFWRAIGAATSGSSAQA